MPRKAIAWAVSIVGWGGYLLLRANQLAGYVGFLELPEDARKALVLMSHAPTLASLILIVIGMIGIIALGYEYGLFRQLALVRRFKTSSDGLLPSIIPTPPIADTNQYMTAHEALHYLADDSEWGAQIRRYIGEIDKITIRKDPLFEAPTELKRLSEQGKIRSFGRLDGVGPHVPIPATYWMSAIFLLSKTVMSANQFLLFRILKEWLNMRT